jgi:L-threonylcarbamoyladenylate synthase
VKTAIGQDILTASAFLRKGELVGIPTETVYGLAANALNPEAVLRIFQVKGRPTFNPLIVHVHDANQFSLYANEVPDVIKLLAEHFCPGPLTFVLPKKSNIPDLVTGGGNTVALRVPGHPLTLQLLKSLDFPLAAPSANPFGYISPVTALHVQEQLDGKVAYILDGGPSMIGVESTVVMMRDENLVVLRVGGVSVESLREVYPHVVVEINQSSNPKSPGQLKSHYAPRIPLKLGVINELLEQHSDKKLAVLSFKNTFSHAAITALEVLSAEGSDTEAARNLFAALRRLDQTNADIIIAEKLPEKGLGMAINDRLERAAADH